MGLAVNISIGWLWLLIIDGAFVDVNQRLCLSFFYCNAVGLLWGQLGGSDLLRGLGLLGLSLFCVVCNFTPLLGCRRFVVAMNATTVRGNTVSVIAT